MLKLDRRSVTLATCLCAASLMCSVLYHEAGGQAQSGGSSIDGATGKRQANQPEVLDPVKNKTDLYRADADAKEELRAALTRAVSEKKRLLMVFGGNWCYDCHVLDRALHEGAAGEVVKEAFLIVHIDIGEGEKNLDLVKKYKVPLEKGVPAVVILNSAGDLLFSSADGEFEAARRMMKRDLVAFLRRWKQNRRTRKKSAWPTKIELPRSLQGSRLQHGPLELIFQAVLLNPGIALADKPDASQYFIVARVGSQRIGHGLDGAPSPAKRSEPRSGLPVTTTSKKNAFALRAQCGRGRPRSQLQVSP